MRRLRQKISSIYCTVICNYPSPAQEQPFTVGLFCITKTVKFTRYALLVFVRSCSSINNKIISLKIFVSPQPVGGPSKRKKIRALGTYPVCPLVKTALHVVRIDAVLSYTMLHVATVLCVCVCFLDTRLSELYKNGWTDQRATLGLGSFLYVFAICIVHRLLLCFHCLVHLRTKSRE